MPTNDTFDDQAAAFERGVNVGFSVENSDHLDALLARAKQAVSVVFDFDWSKVRTQIGYQTVAKLPRQLGLKGELADHEADAMAFNAVTLRNVLDDGALYSILVVEEAMQRPDLPHIVLHEVCHVVTQHLAYEDKQHDLMVCSTTEELAVDLLASLIGMVAEQHKHE